KIKDRLAGSTEGVERQWRKIQKSNEQAASCTLAPRHFGYALFYRARDFSSNAAVFQLTFYRVMFPLIVQLVLVLIPSVWGMRKAVSVARLRPLLRTILSAAVRFLFKHVGCQQLYITSDNR